MIIRMTAMIILRVSFVNLFSKNTVFFILFFKTSDRINGHLPKTILVPLPKIFETKHIPQTVLRMEENNQIEPLNSS